ncbi:unnamed protein product [Closterium sp. Yama58-4]|nr:unnamed protein product [Closterium sp. Yama58-4]
MLHSQSSVHPHDLPNLPTPTPSPSPNSQGSRALLLIAPPGEALDLILLMFSTFPLSALPHTPITPLALPTARALFSRALLLIAPPGEALDFILFMPPAAVVLEIQPSSHPSSSHRALSHSLSLRHHTLFCKYRNLPGQPEKLLCNRLALTLLVQLLSTEVFFSPALPGGSRAERAALRTNSIPGSLIHGQQQVKIFKHWAACIGNKGKWVRNPKPRTLPWDYRGVSNMCDRRYLESHPAGMAYAKYADAYAMSPGATEEGWTVREGVKYEWVVGPSTCPAPQIPEEIKAFERSAKARLEEIQLEKGGMAEARRAAEAAAAAAAVALSNPFLPFNASVFCERVGRGRRILVVGDSKQYQMVESFLNLMAWDRKKPAWEMVGLEDHPKRCVDVLGGDPEKMAHEFCQWYTFNSSACPGLRIDYLRNDHISIFDSRGPNFDRMPWAQPGVADIPSADVIVLNRGQHWTPTPLFVSGVQNALRFVRYYFPGKLIIYRNTPPGHNNCENFDRPLEKRQPTESLPYYWRDLPEQNRLAKELVEQVGGVYLDVEEMLALRADGHHGSAARQQFASVPDLEAAMYTEAANWPCVRLLSTEGPIGCGNPGREIVSAPIQAISLPSQLSLLKSPRALLVSPAVLHPVLSLISKDPIIASHVAGIMVESANQSSVPALSPASPFPQSAFATYPNTSYPWNPLGSSLDRLPFSLPISLLSDQATADVRLKAEANSRRDFRYPLYMAEFDAIMTTTRIGATTSQACLNNLSCLPLGGYSVMASLPPINVASKEPSKKPLVIAMAQMDAASLFRDAAVGAESPISGLICLLAAADAIASLLRKPSVPDLPKQLVFLALNGERWGYLGSRRLLFELEKWSKGEEGVGRDVLQGLSFEDFTAAQMLEVGSVGMAGAGGNGTQEDVTLFVHHEKPMPAGAAAIAEALRTAAASIQGNPQEGETASAAEEEGQEIAGGVRVEEASEETPGFPPSSLLALSAEHPGISALHLSDFNQQVSNPYLNSHLDTLPSVHLPSLTLSSTLLARSLLLLSGAPPSLALQASVNTSLISNLILCLLSPSPGLLCPLASSLLTPRDPAPSHYAGVFLGVPPSVSPSSSSPPSSSSASSPPLYTLADTPRFVWNFLAKTTAVKPRQGEEGGEEGEERGKEGEERGKEGEGREGREIREVAGSGGKGGKLKECVENKDCAAAGEVCVGVLATAKGECLLSSTTYIPALSPRLVFNSTHWSIAPPRPGSHGDLVDPVWTESFWQHLKLRSYLVDDPIWDASILLGGVVWVVVLCVLVNWADKAVTQTLKRV